MRRPLINAALLVTVAAPASAQLTVKDFVLGADLAETAQRFGMVCRSDGPDLKYCFDVGRFKHEALKTIAGVPATRVIITGYDGKLTSVLYTFSSRDFHEVRSAFAERYPKMQCADSVATNRMGAKFEQTKCRYVGGGGQIELNRFGDSITEGILEVSSDAHAEGLKRSADARKGKAKSDI